MATELDHGYCGWPHEELLIQEDSQDAAIPQMLDHGSVSFGRYGVESLAWEKRSAFIHDGRKEELEKLKSPGLVAERKHFLKSQRSGRTHNGQWGDDNVGYRNDGVGDKSLNVGACSDEHDTNVPTETESANTFNGRQSDPKSFLTCSNSSAVDVEAECEDGVWRNSEAVMESKGPRRLPKKSVLGEENPCRRKAASCRFTRKNKSSSGSLRTSQSLHSSFSVGKVKKDAFLLNKDPCNRLPTDKRSGKGTSDIPLGKSTSEARSFRFATQRRPTTRMGLERARSKALAISETCRRCVRFLNTQRPHGMDDRFMHVKIVNLFESVLCYFFPGDITTDGTAVCWIHLSGLLLRRRSSFLFFRRLQATTTSCGR
ncbi:unnamed protein product [Spirodela intermedia]|uniref:Uncharacterized protein n=1 Tax=Spirodela intermedia TaxID=51605 RepID=A0A7I8IQF2_SPIIN|nr:unnamed protein product [Spirodela intermedia]CAA6660208.1 unnamed protein product [Spirodela intermedia]